MECIRPDEKAPIGYSWLHADPRTPLETKLQENRLSIAKALQPTNVRTNIEKPGPFSRPGWLNELLNWAQMQIYPLGLRITGGIRQLNASASFSLVRLETSGPAMWFKATGEPNRHELPISLSLARLFPKHVPTIHAVHSAWNGWLSEGVDGLSLDDLSESSAWVSAARSLAELQIDSIGRHFDLIENQCKDLRLPHLLEQIDPFLERMAHLMAAQEKQTPPPLMRPELALLGDLIKRACSSLQDLNIPETLGHLDLNPNNVFVTPERSVFLDWAEGCVANPLITFEYLREHLKRKGLGDQQTIENLAEAYLRPWQSLFSPDDLKHGTIASPLIAVFAHAVSTNAWRSPDAAPNSSPNAYLRSLTRRMYREATLIAERMPPCLA
jgi:hypothetical protein